MKHYIDDPPAAEHRVTELHAWIATHPDGAEGIASADVDFGSGFGVRHVPLMSSKRKVAEGLKPLAEQVRQEALIQSGTRVTMRLVTFRKVELPNP
jgi:hypothetical protein